MLEGASSSSTHSSVPMYSTSDSTHSTRAGFSTLDDHSYGEQVNAVLESSSSTRPAAESESTPSTRSEVLKAKSSPVSEPAISSSAASRSTAETNEMVYSEHSYTHSSALQASQPSDSYQSSRTGFTATTSTSWEYPTAPQPTSTSDHSYFTAQSDAASERVPTSSIIEVSRFEIFYGLRGLGALSGSGV